MTERLRFRLLFPCLLFATSSMAASLEGTWKTGCINPKPSRIVSLEFTFTDSTFHSTFNQFVSRSCRRSQGVVKVSGTYKLGTESTSKPGLFPIDIVINSATLTPLTGFAAGVMNARAACGYDDWSVNDPKDITGRDCEGDRLPDAGSTAYDIIWLHSGMFNAGEVTSATNRLTPGARPTTLNMRATYHKVGSDDWGISGLDGF